jgi:hypothetical protein
VNERKEMKSRMIKPLNSEVNEADFSSQYLDKSVSKFWKSADKLLPVTSCNDCDSSLTVRWCERFLAVRTVTLSSVTSLTDKTFVIRNCIDKDNGAQTRAETKATINIRVISFSNSRKLHNPRDEVTLEETKEEEAEEEEEEEESFQ